MDDDPSREDGADFERDCDPGCKEGADCWESGEAVVECVEDCEDWGGGWDGWDDGGAVFVEDAGEVLGVDDGCGAEVLEVVGCAVIAPGKPGRPAPLMPQGPQPPGPQRRTIAMVSRSRASSKPAGGGKKWRLGSPLHAHYM